MDNVSGLGNRINGKFLSSAFTTAIIGGFAFAAGYNGEITVMDTMPLVVGTSVATFLSTFFALKTAEHVLANTYSRDEKRTSTRIALNTVAIFAGLALGTGAYLLMQPHLLPADQCSGVSSILCIDKMFDFDLPNISWELPSL